MAPVKNASEIVEVKKKTRSKKAAGGSSPARGSAGGSAAPSAAGNGRAPGRAAESERVIRVRGAKEHNLKNIDVTLPRDRLIVMTGLSGSGKSSLAFDTIFAEGQRKYMESLSAYARQFLDQLKKPDVEEIEGIPPTIAIEQRSAAHNPRSTVATTTEIYDYLRLLYARCGTPRSWAATKTKKDGTVTARSGRLIEASSATQIVDHVMGMGPGTSALRADSAERSGSDVESEAGSESRHTPEAEPARRAGLPRKPGSESRPTTEAGSESRSTTEAGSESRPARESRGTRIMVLAPVVRGKKGHHKEALEDLFKDGWGRVRVNGEIVDLRDALKEGGENPLNLHRYKKHTIEVVVDRVVIRDDARQRLAESVEAALRLGEGSLIVTVESRASEKESGGSDGRDARPAETAEWTDHTFSEKFADPDHPDVALDELSPRLFSFNSPYGACQTCHGLGAILEFAEDLVVPDPDRALLKGGLAPFKKNGPGGMVYPRYLRRFCRAFGVHGSTPMGEIDEHLYEILMHGTTPEQEEEFGVSWDGVLPMLAAWFEKTESAWAKDHLHQFQREQTCPACHGDRLRIESMHVLLESSHKAETGRAFSETVIGRPKKDGSVLNISELSRLNINDAIAFVEGLKLSEEQSQIAEPILREVGNRLRFLTSVGLDYMSLDRRTATLSGGEAQRIRLATQVGSGLVGACYVLDEPTIGLHERDNDRLIRTLRHLTDIGNTVLVVEHDEDMIRSADHVVDIGPGPGVHGGRVVAQGTVEEICAAAGSITGDYLAGRKSIAVPAERRALSEKNAVTIKGARHNNLKKIDAAFPVGGFVCVTGVSGSGKSTLVNEILLKAVRQHLHGSKDRPGGHTRVNGLQRIDRIIEVDQSPIGRTPRSNPATYTGIFDDIRKVFTQTKESKIRGYQPGRFSFNVPPNRGGGRCEACQGQGLKKIEMHFLPDVYVECEVCGGKRYNRETLAVTYRGKNIADVLGMTVEDACGFFENHPKILRFAECLRDVGLDYIELGQPSTTLSGGEAQRVKLATELGKGTRYDGTPSAEHTLYVLDEPTTGLHFEDIRRLLEVLNRLADAGNTLVVIEHNLDVIKSADWIIDLGPEGGDGGGEVVASGTPEAVAKVKGSFTGRYLKKMLG